MHHTAQVPVSLPDYLIHKISPLILGFHNGSLLIKLLIQESKSQTITNNIHNTIQ
jgi:hypothetical protein